MQMNLAEAFHSYSTGDTNSPCCSSFQPQRTVIKKKGVTTLFMPASTGTSVGMKIVSLETPEAPKKKGSIDSGKSGDSTAKSVTSSMDQLNLDAGIYDELAGFGFGSLFCTTILACQLPEHCSARYCHDAGLNGNTNGYPERRGDDSFPDRSCLDHDVPETRERTYYNSVRGRQTGILAHTACVDLQRRPRSSTSTSSIDRSSGLSSS